MLTRQQHRWIDAIALCATFLCAVQLSVSARPYAAPAVQSSTAASSNPPSNKHKESPHQVQTSNPAIAYRLETYHSGLMGSQRSYGVVLPPGYSEHPNQRYPVIFLLHGGHGGPLDWLQPEKGDVTSTLQSLYQRGKLPPSIVITPDGNDQRGSSSFWDPQYIDGPHGNVASAIGNELVQIVQKRYRTLPTPNFWAIGGLSSGAWGAVNIGLRYPNHFGILFSHSGYFVDKTGPQNSPLDVVKMLSSSDRQRLRIYLDAGESDRRYLKQTQTFHQTLNQLGIANVFSAFPGDHGWGFWRQHLSDSLTYVGTQFSSSSIAQIAGSLQIVPASSTQK